MNPDTPTPDNAQPLQSESSTQATPGLQDDESLIDILRTKRKAVSRQKVCQPCRLRKVRCSYDTPCKSCIERGHPELCIYADDPNPKRVFTDLAPNSPPKPPDEDRWSPSRQEWLEMRQDLRSVKAFIQTMTGSTSRHNTTALVHSTPASASAPETASSGNTPGGRNRSLVPGISASSSVTGDTVFLGANSAPALVAALINEKRDSALQEILSSGVLPTFGLENESTIYPFVDLWGIPYGSFQRIELLCNILPSMASDCMSIFKQYRNIAHVIYPGIVDISQFESDLLNFLRQRNNNSLTIQAGSIAEQIVHGKNLHWLGLLFAVLASGFQCSEIPRKERQMKSQVYGKRIHYKQISKVIMLTSPQSVAPTNVSELSTTSHELHSPIFKHCWLLETSSQTTLMLVWLGRC